MVYLVLYILALDVGISMRAPGDFAASAFVAHLLLVSSWAATWNVPAWSVSAKWFAYLWFPLLVFSLRPASLRLCAILLVADIMAFAWVYAHYFDGTMNHLGLVRICFEFPAGYLLYRIAFHAPLNRLVGVQGSS
jgi:peptidoglycan/LPS O-acetylase OafA/YrhL